MQIHAHFTGLRYLMFHWPILSAVVGIGFNLLLIIFVLLVSWYHLFYSEGSAYQYTKNIRERFATMTEMEKDLKKQNEGKYNLITLFINDLVNMCLTKIFALVKKKLSEKTCFVLNVMYRYL